VEKGWSVFFGVVLLATFLIWFAAPYFGWWLPENVSSYGGGVDLLFYLILGFTGFFFVLTEVIMVYAMWKFTERPGEKSQYTHGNHKLELLWTAVPAAILLFIAFAQIPAWAEMKIRAWPRIQKPETAPPPEVVVSITARQWEWRMRYPVETDRFLYSLEDDAETIRTRQRAARYWADNPEIDDLDIPAELHCWKNADVRIYLRTVDVLHSFTVPNLRLKQDALPGKTLPVWFKAERHNCRFEWTDKDKKIGRLIETGDKRDAWEIACQELCGARHYAMRGRFYVHEDADSYKAWLEASKARQQSREPVKTTTGN
jgi:cytochrome c oxidase subunit 2